MFRKQGKELTARFTPIQAEMLLDYGELKQMQHPSADFTAFSRFIRENTVRMIPVIEIEKDSNEVKKQQKKLTKK